MADGSVYLCVYWRQIVSREDAWRAERDVCAGAQVSKLAHAATVDVTGGPWGDVLYGQRQGGVVCGCGHRGDGAQLWQRFAPSSV